MSQVRVLYVSRDSAARAAAKSDVAERIATVVTARSVTASIVHLDQDAFDAIVIDGTSISNVSRLLSVVKGHDETSAYFTWNTDGHGVTTAVERIFQEPDGNGPRGVIEAVATDVGREHRSKLDRTVEEIKSRLADARTPGAVERALREEFTDTETFDFAWVGEYDRGEHGIVPWVTESEIDWPIMRSFPLGDGDNTLLERVVRTRSLRVHEPLAEDPSAAPLGSVAMERAVTAVAVVPLATETEFYGVLVCYAGDRLSAHERSALEDVAETTTYVLEAVSLRGQFTQQKQALRRYERLVETAGDGMYVLDDEGCFTTVNPALVEMSGYRREGLLGEPASILFGEEGDRTRSETVEALVRAEENADRIELTVRTKDGEEVPCETQVAVLVHSGNLLGSVGVVRDVTDRKRRERMLRRQNERLDAFASIVSHDLRNPLGIAQGYVDLVTESGEIEHLENVTDALDRMESIVTDVLAIARQGEWVAETEPVALERAALEAWENVSTADGTMTVEDTITFDADRSQFLRLLENLFRNAIEHGTTSTPVQAHQDTDEPDEPSVEVWVGSIEDGPDETGESPVQTGFYVEDDGPGMPEEIRERVFDADFTTGSDGLGIGLWVVDEVARAHGWKCVATERDGGGARFEFWNVDE